MASPPNGQLRSKEAWDQDLEIRCQDSEPSIASIQPKYQEVLNNGSDLEHKHNLAGLRQTHLLRSSRIKRVKSATSVT
jgi:hypothetical protein